MIKRLTCLLALIILAAGAVCAVVLRNKTQTEDFSWKPFDKAYFAFVLDDTNEFTGPMARVFHEKGVPLSVAAIREMLGTQAVGMSGTIADVLRLVEEDGGEILAHYSGNLADPGYGDGEHFFESSDTVWMEKTVGCRDCLSEMGFTVRGIMRADYSQVGSAQGEQICRRYFEYSDGLGRSAQYQLSRTFLMSFDSVEGFLEWIDEACAAPGFYPVCFHGWETIGSPEQVAVILDYILEQHGEDASITTYAGVYDRFGFLNSGEK